MMTDIEKALRELLAQWFEGLPNIKFSGTEAAYLIRRAIINERAH